MIDKASDVAHPVAINDSPAIQIKAVMVTILGVLLCHASSELLLTDHLPHILQDVLTCGKQNIITPSQPHLMSLYYTTYTQ